MLIQYIREIIIVVSLICPSLCSIHIIYQNAYRYQGQRMLLYIFVMVILNHLIACLWFRDIEQMSEWQMIVQGYVCGVTWLCATVCIMLLNLVIYKALQGIILIESISKEIASYILLTITCSILAILINYNFDYSMQGWHSFGQIVYFWVGSDNAYTNEGQLLLQFNTIMVILSLISLILSYKVIKLKNSIDDDDISSFLADIYLMPIANVMIWLTNTTVRSLDRNGYYPKSNLLLNLLWCGLNLLVEFTGTIIAYIYLYAIRAKRVQVVNIQSHYDNVVPLSSSLIY